MAKKRVKIRIHRCQFRLIFHPQTTTSCGPTLLFRPQTTFRHQNYTLNVARADRKYVITTFLSLSVRGNISMTISLFVRTYQPIIFHLIYSLSSLNRLILPRLYTCIIDILLCYFINLSKENLCFLYLIMKQWLQS